MRYPPLVSVFGFGLIAVTPAFATPYQVTTPFSEQDFQPWTGSGPATVRGQAFLKTMGGDVKTCAGQKVILIPANAYGLELVQADKAGYSDVSNIDPRFSNYVHQTICDAQGNFTFTDLPAQPWAVETSVLWHVPHIDQPGDEPGPLAAFLSGAPPPPEMDQQGGALIQEVTPHAGDNQVFLTSDDEIH